MIKVCESCEKEFETTEEWEITCSDECHDAYWEDYANHQYDGVDFGDEDA
jgi:hypothetical protein